MKQREKKPLWEKRSYWLAIRGGIALGLALTGIWVMGLTADTSGTRDKLEALAQNPAVTVGLLRSQLGVEEIEAEQDSLTGWGTLVVEQSALLKRGLSDWKRAESKQELLPESAPLTEQTESLSSQTDPESGETTLTIPQEENTDVLEITSVGNPGTGVIYSQGIYLINKSDCTVSEADLEMDSFVPQFGDGPQILIVHTHGSEAYTQSGEDTYEESDPYRTTDCTKNVVRVGEEMAMELRAHGFRVIHDTNLYDYPSYNGAYDRSRTAVRQWMEQYPTIEIVLDVHRDALVSEDGKPYKMISMEAGEKVAQIMLVMGSESAGNQHVNWKQNLAFAAWLQRSVQKSYTSLARPMVLRNGSFNQQLAVGSVLVEVGGHGNTLQEAIAGARLWADRVARTLRQGE